MIDPNDPYETGLWRCDSCENLLDADHMAEEGIYGHTEVLCHPCLVLWLCEEAGDYEWINVIRPEETRKKNIKRLQERKAGKRQ